MASLLFRNYKLEITCLPELVSGSLLQSKEMLKQVQQDGLLYRYVETHNYASLRWHFVGAGFTRPLLCLHRCTHLFLRCE